MFSNLSAGQAYALGSFVVVGVLLSVLGLYDTVIVIATGHDSETITILLRFVIGVFGATGASSAIAIVRHIGETNGNGH